MQCSLETMETYLENSTFSWFHKLLVRPIFETVLWGFLFEDFDSEIKFFINFLAGRNHACTMHVVYWNLISTLDFDHLNI